MKIISEQLINLPDIVEALQKGKTMVYPTETCYGLGCDATKQEAVDKIFAIKKRQKEKTVLVVMSNVDMAMRYVDWNPTLARLADTFWPGPLTIVAPLKSGVFLPQGIVSSDNTIAFRVSNHSFVDELCKLLGVPIVSTSANIASEASPYDIQDVKKVFVDAVDNPDILIDSGILPDHSPSTIVRVVEDTVEILRQGEIVVSSK